MFIIADCRLPITVHHRLEQLGTVLWVPVQHFAYQAIAAHPDIFFCQTENKFIVAPNAPKQIISKMLEYGAEILFGTHPVGNKHPETTCYNAVFTNTFFIHNTKYSDKQLLQQAANKITVHVEQGYTRCNLLPLSDKSFLCSDRNIERALKQHGAEVLFVRPEEILLPGVKYGFIGGCCGIFDKTIVIAGSLAKHSQTQEITAFLEQHNITIIELYNGALWDGGGILFEKEHTPL
jgi:N-dimethylarginine dimethylaminohydrolase